MLEKNPQKCENILSLNVDETRASKIFDWRCIPKKNSISFK
jgi:hypothetical protein